MIDEMRGEVKAGDDGEGGGKGGREGRRDE